MSIVLRVSRALFVSAVLAALPAAAGSHTWTGGMNGNWSSGANWTGTPPFNGESNVQLVFPAGQGNMAAMNNDVTGLNVTSMVFHDTAYMLVGNAIAFAGTITVDGGSPGLLADVQVTMSLTGDATFQVTGTGDYGLELDGHINGAHNVTIQNTVAGGTPVVVFTNANGYLGTTTVQSGYLEITHPAAL